MTPYFYCIFIMFISWMFITASFKKSLIVEKFQGNYLKYYWYDKLSIWGLLVKPLVLRSQHYGRNLAPHLSFLIPSLHARLQPGAREVPGTPSRFSEHSANCKFLSDYVSTLVACDPKGTARYERAMSSQTILGTPIPTMPRVSETSLLRPKTSLCGIVT